MRLRELQEVVQAELLCGVGALDESVRTCFAADLMSDVLAFSGSDALLVTGLATVQSVHAADVADCLGILLVSGKRPSPDALHLGQSKHMLILSTAMSMFETCGVLSRHGLLPSHKERG
ncbi:MAG TPA: hypothetical protein PLS53_09905 [Thermoanaerobaculaceae bacterium]|nr:hypothetical protein [Thermoanaerobaculaceae bacterium]HPS78457.1 hypothetical protein [Thermoanaerobaculaceae bacterium]